MAQKSKKRPLIYPLENTKYVKIGKKSYRIFCGSKEVREFSNEKPSKIQTSTFKEPFKKNKKLDFFITEKPVEIPEPEVTIQEEPKEIEIKPKIEEKPDVIETPKIKPTIQIEPKEPSIEIKKPVEIPKPPQPTPQPIKPISQPKQPSSFTFDMFIGKKNFGKIIGFQGTTKSKIEKESKCKILIPKRESTSNNIKIIAKNKQSYLHCKDLIENILPKEFKTSQKTHFFSIRLGKFKKFSALQEMLFDEFYDDKILPEKKIFISGHRLHLTLSVLTVNSDAELERLKTIIDGTIKPYMHKDLSFSEMAEKNLVLTFDHLDVFPKHSVKKARVLNLKVSEDKVKKKIQKLYVFINKLMKKEGFIGKKESGKELVLHSTVVNTKYSKTIKRINATKILEMYGKEGKKLDSCKFFKKTKFYVKNLELSLMGGDQDHSKYYKCIYKIPFNKKK